jgi:hypothetical protein
MYTNIRERKERKRGQKLKWESNDEKAEIK